MQSVTSSNPNSYPEKIPPVPGRALLFIWNFPLVQFAKIVAVYGSILNFILMSFINYPFSFENITALGFLYYLVFFEIPLLFRPQKSAQLRVIAKDVSLQQEDTKNRGRQTVEAATGKKAIQ